MFIKSKKNLQYYNNQVNLKSNKYLFIFITT